MRIYEVEQILHKRICEYAKTLDADISYKSEKKTAEFCMPLKRCDIIFKLTKKEKLIIPVGTLYCQIGVGKTDREKYFLHEIINVLNAEDFRTTMFTYLYKEERIDKAFIFLVEILEYYKADIENILTDENIRKTLYDNRLMDIKKTYRLNDERFAKICEDDTLDIYQGMIEEVLVQRFTKYAAYQCYLKCNFIKAVKVYNKLIGKDRALIYEKELCKYIESGNIIEPLPEGFEIVAAPEEKPKEFFKLILLPFVILSSVMLLILFIMNAFLHQDTVYTDSIEWYYTFIFAYLPAIFTGIASRRAQYKLYKNKDFYELDLIRDSKGENKFVNIAALVVVVIVFAVFIDIVTMGTKLYSDHLVINESEELLTRDWQTYYYKDIDKVYYIEGRYNYYGEYVKRASYVLTFKDGRQLDTDMWDSLEQMRKKVFPIMHIENKEVIKVHSERNIKK